MTLPFYTSASTSRARTQSLVSLPHHSPQVRIASHTRSTTSRPIPNLRKPRTCQTLDARHWMPDTGRSQPLCHDRGHDNQLRLDCVQNRVISEKQAIDDALLQPLENRAGNPCSLNTRSCWLIAGAWEMARINAYYAAREHKIAAPTLFCISEIAELAPRDLITKLFIQSYPRAHSLEFDIPLHNPPGPK